MACLAIEEGVVLSDRRSTLLAGTCCGSYVGQVFVLVVFRQFCVWTYRDRDSQSPAWFFSKLQDIFVLKHHGTMRLVTVPRLSARKSSRPAQGTKCLMKSISRKISSKPRPMADQAGCVRTPRSTFGGGVWSLDCLICSRAPEFNKLVRAALRKVSATVCVPEPQMSSSGRVGKLRGAGENDVGECGGHDDTSCAVFVLSLDRGSGEAQAFC